MILKKWLAEILSKQYSSVFSIPIEPDNLPKITTPDRIKDICFTEEDIIEAINELDSTSAAGRYGFPTVFLKKCKNTLTKKRPY